MYTMCYPRYLDCWLSLLFNEGLTSFEDVEDSLGRFVWNGVCLAGLGDENEV